MILNLCVCYNDILYANFNFNQNTATDLVLVVADYERMFISTEGKEINNTFL